MMTRILTIFVIFFTFIPLLLEGQQEIDAWGNAYVEYLPKDVV